MSSGFNSGDLTAITWFAHRFLELYGSDSFRSTDNMRDVPANPGLNALVAKVRTNPALFTSFRGELAWDINDLSSNPTEFMVTATGHEVRVTLQVPVSATLMSIFPSHGPARTSNADLIRERWMQTRLFTLTDAGIHIIPSRNMRALTQRAG